MSTRQEQAMSINRLLTWRWITFIGMLSGAVLLASLWIHDQPTGLFLTSWKWQLGGIATLLFFSTMAFAFTASWMPAWTLIEKNALKSLGVLRRLGLFNLTMVFSRRYSPGRQLPPRENHGNAPAFQQPCCSPGLYRGSGNSSNTVYLWRFSQVKRD
jgi:hypothetical protein